VVFFTHLVFDRQANEVRFSLSYSFFVNGSKHDQIITLSNGILATLFTFYQEVINPSSDGGIEWETNTFDIAININMNRILMISVPF
jgi:hypothetical protein